MRAAVYPAFPPPETAAGTGQTPDPKAGFRTKTVGARMTPGEVREVEDAAKQAGKTLGEWVRETALGAARQRPTDPVELLLQEQAATRYMLLNLFHASAQAAQGGAALLPETVLQIREKADARKLATASKLLQDFFAAEGGRGAKP